MEWMNGGWLRMARLKDPNSLVGFAAVKKTERERTTCSHACYLQLEQPGLSPRSRLAVFG
jgi:hypothetical protein